MSILVKSILFWGILAGLGIWSFRGLWKTSEFVHTALRNFRKEAENSLNREALLGVRKRLCAFARKECVVRAFGDHAREVIAYIDGRLGAWNCGKCNAPNDVALMRNQHETLQSPARCEPS